MYDGAFVPIGFQAAADVEQNIHMIVSAEHWHVPGLQVTLRLVVKHHYTSTQ